jgi:hypothetical protein
MVAAAQCLHKGEKMIKYDKFGKILSSSYNGFAEIEDFNEGMGPNFSPAALDYQENQQAIEGQRKIKIFEAAKAASARREKAHRERMYEFKKKIEKERAMKLGGGDFSQSKQLSGADFSLFTMGPEVRGGLAPQLGSYYNRVGDFPQVQHGPVAGMGSDVSDWLGFNWDLTESQEEKLARIALERAIAAGQTPPPQPAPIIRYLNPPGTYTNVPIIGSISKKALLWISLGTLGLGVGILIFKLAKGQRAPRYYAPQAAAPLMAANPKKRKKHRRKR